MAYQGISGWTARPALALALRYGLAVSAVATALGTTLLLEKYNFPPRFVSHFILIALAITFWCGGQVENGALRRTRRDPYGAIRPVEVEA